MSGNEDNEFYLKVVYSLKPECPRLSVKCLFRKKKHNKGIQSSPQSQIFSYLTSTTFGCKDIRIRKAISIADFFATFSY